MARLITTVAIFFLITGCSASLPQRDIWINGYHSVIGPIMLYMPKGTLDPENEGTVWGYIDKEYKDDVRAKRSDRGDET